MYKVIITPLFASLLLCNAYSAEANYKSKIELPQTKSDIIRRIEAGEYSSLSPNIAFDYDSGQWKLLQGLRKNTTAQLIVICNRFKYDVNVNGVDVAYAKERPAVVSEGSPAQGATRPLKVEEAVDSLIMAASEEKALTGSRLGAYKVYLDGSVKDLTFSDLDKVREDLLSAYRKQKPKNFADPVLGSPTILNPKYTMEEFAQQIEFVIQAIKGEHFITLFPFQPRADDYELEVLVSERRTNADSLEGGDPIGGGTTNKTPSSSTNLKDSSSAKFPVSFNLFESVSLSWSIGFAGTSLNDDKFALVPLDDSNSTITLGAQSKESLYAMTLLHFSVWKKGDFMTGPALGFVTNDAKDFGTFFGWSFLLGKDERFALSIGYLNAKVARLNGYTVGNNVPNGTVVTSNVSRTGFCIGLTYALPIGSSSKGSDSGGK